MIETLSAFLYYPNFNYTILDLLLEFKVMSAHEINILVTVSAISIAYLGGFFVYGRMLK